MVENKSKKGYEGKYKIYLNDNNIIRKGYELIIFNINGEFKYYLNGQYHRIGGPAYGDFSGYEVWMIDNVTHRIGGPAKTYPHGTKEYWIDDKLYNYVTGGIKQYWNDIFYNQSYSHQLIKICPFCDKYSDSYEENAVHVDQEIELDKYTSDLQKEYHIQKWIEYIINPELTR